MINKNKIFTFSVLTMFLISLAAISLLPLYEQYLENNKKEEELNLFLNNSIKKYNLNEKEIIEVKNNNKKQVEDFLEYLKKCEESAKDKICKNLIPLNNF